MQKFNKINHDSNVIVIGETLFIYNFMEASISEYEFTRDGDDYFVDLARPNVVTTGYDSKDLDLSIPAEGRTYLIFTN